MREKLIAFLKGSVVLTIANVCTKAINFVLLPLYTKYLTPEQLGVSDSITTITSLIFPVLVLGLDSAYSAFYFDENTCRHKRAVFSSILLILLVTSILPIISIIFANEISILLFNSSRYSIAVILALLGMSCNLWYLPFSIYLRVENRMTAFAIINVVASITMIASNIITVYALNMGASALIVSTLVTNIVMLLLYVACSKYLPKLSDFDINLSKKMLKYSVPLVPMGISTWVLTASSRVMLLEFLGEESVGLYGIGSRFVSVVNVFTNSIYMAYTTFAFSSKDEKNSKTVYVVILDTMNLFLTAGVFVVCIFSKEILAIMVDQQYYDAYILLPGLLFAQIFYAANTIVSYGLSFEKKSGMILLSVTVAAVISVILNFIFIPQYGVFASTIASWAGYGIMLLTVNRFSQKVYECPYNIKKLVAVNMGALFITLASLRFATLALRIIICLISLLALLFIYRDIIDGAISIVRNRMKGTTK